MKPLHLQIISALAFTVVTALYAVTFHSGSEAAYRLWYYTPAAFAAGAFTADRYKLGRIKNLNWMVDLAVVALCLCRPLFGWPPVSGHALFAVYVLVSASSVFPMAAAVLLGGVTLYAKIWLWNWDSTLWPGLIVGLVAGLYYLRLSDDLGGLIGYLTDRKMASKIGKCHIRRLSRSDYPVMEMIYLNHEGVSIPHGHFENFKETLRNGEIIHLVAEVDGVVVGGGGLVEYDSDGRATLIFGLVAPEKCRKGYGTSILLARLLLAASRYSGCRLTLQATEWSKAFFTRIGFEWYQEETDGAGDTFYYGIQAIYPDDRELLNQLLITGGVTFDNSFNELLKLRTWSERL